ncbi:MAG: transglutaminase domain-containing protein, partial [Anaerolineaceae bacterium]
SLVKIVQGLMIHVFWIEKYGIRLDAARKEEVQLRFVEKMLTRILELDPRPLTEARPLEKRLVGNCRDFSVLLTAMLRHFNIPARARCGFANYFMPNHHEDHWVVEYWNAGRKRWVLVDSQLDELQSKKLSIPFDPLDVPRDQFLVGGKAWQLCRAGKADPDTFGIFDMKGLWMVRGNLIRDVASLNKVELLPWDAWGLMDKRDEELTPDDLAFLDRVADLTNGDVPEFEKLRELYEKDKRLHVPQVIKSYTQAGVQTINLEDF